MNLKSEILGRLRALILLSTAKLFPARALEENEEVWLIGENQGECLEDNGLAFYQYCRQAHPEKHIYFLVKKDSPLYASNLLGDDHAVEYGSSRHIRLFLRANVLFYTHTYRDFMYRRFFEYFGSQGKLVYLHHGTLGFKKIDAFGCRNRNIMEIFTVGSSLEREILLNQLDVDEHRVKVTGYARSDRFLQNKPPLRRQLLYIPTHRRHIRGIEKQNFIDRLDSLFNNIELTRLLDEHDLVLKVYLHAHMQKTLTLKTVDNSRIQMVEMGIESVHDLICSSILMITDYSSVAWEFLSLQKPVLFYRFDIDSFLAARDSYIDLRDETYGEIAYDEEQLADLLRQYLEGTRSFREEIRSAVGSVLSDGSISNCEQIYQLVSQSLGSSSKL